jgi:hypothetical protein
MDWFRSFVYGHNRYSETGSISGSKAESGLLAEKPSAI